MKMCCFFIRLNKISPQSTGSVSSGSTLYKRKYSPHIEPNRDTSNQTNFMSGANAKRMAYNSGNTSLLYCIYCTKNDFDSLEQLHSHIQQMHAGALQEVHIHSMKSHFLCTLFSNIFSKFFSSIFA